MRFWSAACLAACMGLILAGCSKASDEAASTASEPAYAKRSDSEYPATAGYANGQAPLHEAARQAGAERSVVRQGTLSVEVANLDKAETAMKETVGKAGGYIDHEEGTDLASETPVLHLVIKVPEPAFESSLTAFESLGRRTSKSIQASDVTEEILDTQARLQQLQRDRDVLVKQGQGTALNSGFESMKDRIKALQQERDELSARASMSTIDLTLQQKPNLDLAASASSSWSGDTWNAALSSAMAAFHVVGAAVIWILAYSPFWLLVCGIGWWGFRARRQGRATTV